MKLFTASLSGLILAAASVIPGYASTIELGLTGDVNVGYTSIDFSNGRNFIAPPGSGNFVVSEMNGGMLEDAGVRIWQFGTIQSLTENNAVVSINESTPFISLENGTVNFYATSFPAGETIGSFTLTETASGTIGELDVDGYFTDAVTGVTEDYTGTLTAAFNGYTPGELESVLPIDVPYVGTFSVDLMDPTPTPEPASLLLMGTGLIGAGIFSRRKLRKS